MTWTVNLSLREDGQYEAVVRVSDDQEFHAVGDEPGIALIRLGKFWLSQPKLKHNDTAELFKVLIDRRDLTTPFFNAAGILMEENRRRIDEILAQDDQP